MNYFLSCHFTEQLSYRQFTRPSLRVRVWLARLIASMLSGRRQGEPGDDSLASQTLTQGESLASKTMGTRQRRMATYIRLRNVKVKKVEART